jgi:CHC2 zinc finger/Toprim-like
MKMTVTFGSRPDWKTERERIDVAAVTTGLLGPAPGRRGERGRRLWWYCPFHEDRNPSFCVDPGKRAWRCYGCGQNGDAAALVMRLRNLSFPEAVAFLTGGPAPTRRTPIRPPTRPAPKPSPKPSGLTEGDAAALVQAAAARLWTPEGADALVYLTGPSRCLSAETIRATRLGWSPGVSIPTRDGDRSFRALGVVVPWFVGDRLALVKIRQPDGRKPKYAEAFRDPSRLVCYPSPATIRPGRPLVIVEGEFDALAVGEVLGEMAAVVTLGSASARPEAHALGPMLAVTRWYIATDADPAGDKSADGWPARARCVRPPGSFKDWTEARAGGVNLPRWWGDIFAGIERPALFSWPELSRWRWGGANEAPGIDRLPTRETP